MILQGKIHPHHSNKIHKLDIISPAPHLGAVIFDELEVWFDPVARPGPEAMAVDEVLLAISRLPLLRIYHWAGAWGSLGYFGKIAEAQEKIPAIQWVRRWTGGGIVDHRADWTYSLIVPKNCHIATLRGGESYRAIHEILTRVLAAEGHPSALSHTPGKSGGLCFENPVQHDVINPAGQKIAGAAQRRSNTGLLHQGSVAPAADPQLRGKIFAESLAHTWTETSLSPDALAVEKLVATKYSTPAWLNRR